MYFLQFVLLEIFKKKTLKTHTHTMKTKTNIKNNKNKTLFEFQFFANQYLCFFYFISIFFIRWSVFALNAHDIDGRITRVAILCFW